MSIPTLKYKGFIATCELDLNDGIVIARVTNSSDVVTAHAESVAELEKAFQGAIDSYLQFCNECGSEPCRSYSGKFNVRISEERHKWLAERAVESSMSINDLLNSIIEEKQVNEMLKTSQPKVVLLTEHQSTYKTLSVDAFETVAVDKNAWSTQLKDSTQRSAFN